MTPKVSVIIPSRNEAYLIPTVMDVLHKSTGLVEVVVVIEGTRPHDMGFATNPRVKVVFHDVAQGMRPAINDGVAASSGEFICKLDAHCMVDVGWDQILRNDCDDETIMVPRRYGLDPENWKLTDSEPVDYHRLTYPFQNADDPDDWSAGIQAIKWLSRGRERRNRMLDEEITSQGSCYFMSRKLWDRIGPLDHLHYRNLVNELEELGFRAWLSGGRVMVNKKTWYAHWFKSKRRGYSLSRGEINEGYQYCVRFWMLDEWKERQRDFKWLLERFMPLPGWPADLDEVFRRARRVMPPTT